jgi:predicted  nucleic acid-binding Zn-ribbon protein
VVQGLNNTWVTATVSAVDSEVSYALARLSKLEDQLDAYRTESYQNVTNDAELKALIKIIDYFLDQHLQLQTKIQTQRDEVTVAKASKGTSVPFKLEKIQLPKFSGKFTEWNIFNDLLTLLAPSFVC